MGILDSEQSRHVHPDLARLHIDYQTIVDSVATGTTTVEQAEVALAKLAVYDRRGVRWTIDTNGNLLRQASMIAPLEFGNPEQFATTIPAVPTAAPAASRREQHLAEMSVPAKLRNWKTVALGVVAVVAAAIFFTRAGGTHETPVDPAPVTTLAPAVPGTSRPPTSASGGGGRPPALPTSVPGAPTTVKR